MMTERYFKLDDAPENYEGEEAMAYVNGANFGYEVGKLEHHSEKLLKQARASQPAPLLNERLQIIEDAKAAGFGIIEIKEGVLITDNGTFDHTTMLTKFAELQRARASQPAQEPVTAELGTWGGIKIVKPHQSQPAQEPVLNIKFEIDQLTEEFIAELDDKTVLIIAGGNRGKWAQAFNAQNSNVAFATHVNELKEDIKSYIKISSEQSELIAELEAKLAESIALLIEADSEISWQAGASTEKEVKVTRKKIADFLAIADKG